MKKLSDKIDVQTILNLILAPGTHAIVSGYRVKVSGVRLSTFAQKGADCICCGRKGEFFRVEDNGSGAHLNLYAYGTDGREKLMTRDHIIPKSMKGPESVANMSPMCQRCNSMRGVLDQAQFIADYQAGRYGRDGDLTIAKLNEKLERRLTGKKPREEVRLMMEEHIKEHGFESHMNRVWIKSAGKLWIRKEVVEACKEKGDELGLAIMVFVNKNDSNRRKIGNYAKGHAPAPEMGIKQAFGILQTLSRQHLDNPTDVREAKLRAHLKLCKGIKR